MSYARGRNAVIVGALTTAAFVTFGALFLIMTNRGFGAYRADLFVDIAEAPGLGKGDPVVFRGVSVGEVRSLDFAPAGRVVVKARLTRTLPLGTGGRALLVPVDLFGRMSLVLRAGRGEAPFQSGDTLAGSAPRSVTDRVESLSDRVEVALSDTVLDLVKGTIGNAGIAAADAATLARSATTLLETQQESLREVSLRASDVARNLRDLTDPERMDETRARLDASLERFAQLTARSDSVMTSFLLLAETVRSGKGTASRLLNDEELYLRTVGALESLEALLVDLRENPKRYINVSVF